MPDEIVHLDGVSDNDWRLLQELWPVYVCKGFDFDQDEFEPLVCWSSMDYSYTMLVEAGTHENVYKRRGLTRGLTAKRRKAFYEWQGAGSRYLEKYAGFMLTEAERLAKLERQRRDDEGWTEIRVGRGNN